MVPTNKKARFLGEATPIYTVSRLFRQNAPIWESIIRELERDKDFLLSVYAPVRIGINIEMRSPGKGESALEHSLYKLENLPNYKPIAVASRASFAAFRDLVLPKIQAIEVDYVNRPGGSMQFVFEGFLLQGSFHAKVRLKNNEFRYLYIHPSLWDEDQTLAFIELLAIMGESAYGCKREDIWFIDLRYPQIIAPVKSYVRLRKELASTLGHLRRVRSAYAS